MASQRGIAGLHQGAGNEQVVEQPGPAQHHALLCERRLNRQGIGVEAERARSEEHPSELQSLMRISYAVFCLKQKTIEIASSSETTNIVVRWPATRIMTLT